MNTLMKVKDHVSITMVRNRRIDQKVDFKNPFKVEHFDKNGNLIGVYDFLNDITNEGRNLILDVMFNGATQIGNANWAIGLIGNVSWTGVAPGDTMGSHTGWTEFTSYTQSTRVAWGPVAPAGQAITNSTAATFDINAIGTLKGVFIVSNNVKNGITGKLWSSALFASDVPVSNGDQIKITYTVSC